MDCKDIFMVIFLKIDIFMDMEKIPIDLGKIPVDK